MCPEYRVGLFAICLEGEQGENVENCWVKLFIFCCKITEQQHYLHTYNYNAVKKRENKGMIKKLIDPWGEGKLFLPPPHVPVQKSPFPYLGKLQPGIEFKYVCPITQILSTGAAYPVETGQNIWPWCCAASSRNMEMTWCKNYICLL